MPYYRFSAQGSLADQSSAIIDNRPTTSPFKSEREYICITVVLNDTCIQEIVSFLQECPVSSMTFKRETTVFIHVSILWWEMLPISLYPII